MTSGGLTHSEGHTAAAQEQHITSRNIPGATQEQHMRAAHESSTGPAEEHRRSNAAATQEQHKSRTEQRRNTEAHEQHSEIT